MGNCCCAESSPCDHTVDETRELLNSDSKALGSTEGTEAVNSSPKLETEDSKHKGEDAEDARPQMVTAHLDTLATSPEAHAESSYSSVIQSLHTNVSHAEQAHQNASYEVTEVVGIAEEAGAEEAGAEETGAEETGAALSRESNTPLHSTEGPIEIITSEVTEEAEAKMTNLVKMDEERTTVPADQVAPAEGVVSREELLDTAPRLQGEQNVSEADSGKKEPKAPAELLTKEEEAAQSQASEASKMCAADRLDDLPTLTDVAQNADGAEMRVTETGSAELQEQNLGSAKPQEPAREMDVAEKAVIAQVNSEEAGGEPSDRTEETHKDDVSSKMAEVTEDSLLSASQDHSKQVSSPDVELSDTATPHDVENGQPDDPTELRDENPSNADVTLKLQALTETERCSQTCQKPLHTVSQAKLLPGPSSNISSIAEQVDESESRDISATEQETTLSLSKEQEVAESLLNGLDSFSPVQKPEFTETHSDAAQVEDAELKSKVTGPREALSLDEHIQEEEEPGAQPSEKEAEKTTTVVQETVEKEDTENHKGQKGEIILTSSHAVEVAVIPVIKSEAFTDKEQEDEDLYRGAEEIEKEPHPEKQPKALLEFTIPGVEESCSLATAVDILTYSEREWKGNTAKSALIRKGYSEISCSFSGLRRVRGDNYCALRATLYQVLATTTQTPAWLLEDDFTSLPEKLEAQEHLIGGWVFPLECRKVGEKEDAVEKLKRYLELLQKKWRTTAESDSPEDKHRVCERAFQGGEEEYGLLEALKLLMLARAVELHTRMQAGQDVPVFCWLLFARDTSENPRTFLANHLSHVGLGGGVEQVEMFLLGYALQHTIQAFRLYKMDTEEFVTHYPDDHKQDWPCVSIITEDDRHYNVPVRKPVQYQQNDEITMFLPLMS